MNHEKKLKKTQQILVFYAYKNIISLTDKERPKKEGLGPNPHRLIFSFYVAYNHLSILYLRFYRFPHYFSAHFTYSILNATKFPVYWHAYQVCKIIFLIAEFYKIKDKRRHSAISTVPFPYISYQSHYVLQCVIFPYKLYQPDYVLPYVSFPYVNYQPNSVFPCVPFPYIL
jgi:hypothetical protein